MLKKEYSINGSFERKFSFLNLFLLDTVTFNAFRRSNVNDKNL